MHEYSVTKELVELCNREAKQNDIKDIQRVRITVGRFTGFSPEAIQFYFEYLCPGTRCENAKLIFSETPIKLLCRDCAQTSEIEQPVMVCPLCGGTNIEITSGREFYIESIEGE